MLPLYFFTKAFDFSVQKTTQIIKRNYNIEITEILFILFTFLT